MPKLFSNLDLNGATSSRVQPKVGTWGPEGVPSTRHKKWLRIGSVVAFVAAFAAVLGFATWIYFNVMNPSQEKQEAAPATSSPGLPSLSGLTPLQHGLIAGGVTICFVLVYAVWKWRRERKAKKDAGA